MRISILAFLIAVAGLLGFGPLSCSGAPGAIRLSEFTTNPAPVISQAIKQGFQFQSNPRPLWYWWASIGSHPLHGERMKLYVSINGTNWAAATSSTYDYRDPDEYTNNVNGPIATEFTVQYAAGQWWAVYNYDPYNTNVNAQALAIARSFDGTNWTRHALLYLQGKTNAGAMFAATWFTEGITNYLVYGYRTGAYTLNKNIYITRRLDDTFTNWGPSVMILSNNVAKWDGCLVKADTRYQLYFTDGSLAVSVATNVNLTSLFTLWTSEIVFSGEAPNLIKVSPRLWRLYYRGAGGMYYAETYDQAVTWPVQDIVLTDDSYWHGPGIVYQGTTPGERITFNNVRTNIGTAMSTVIGSLPVEINGAVYQIPIYAK